MSAFSSKHRSSRDSTSSAHPLVLSTSQCFALAVVVAAAPAFAPLEELCPCVSSFTLRDSASMSAPYVTTVGATPSSFIRRNVSNAFSTSPALAHALINVVYALQSGRTPASYISTNAANPDLASPAAAQTDRSMLYRRTSG